MSDEELGAENARLRAELLAERGKAEAFANLSHEIRTLLSGVIGITGLLLDTELSAEQRDYGKRIRTSGDALLDLINNVLDFSKIDAHKLDLERTDFDLRRTVDEVGEMLAERAHAKGIELCVVASSLPAAVRGDPARLRQVLVNLLSNAIKFTDHGEVVLRATVAEREPGSVLARFEVSDTGVGISPDGVARLFQPFSQVHEDRGRLYGGSGLGLALAKRLIESMGGTIGVTSEPGKGSTFTCTARLERKGDRSAIPRVDLAGRRALVASASATVRGYVAEIVGALELESETADDGEVALRAMREAAAAGRPFDVAVLDANLASGKALLRAMAADDALAELPVIALAYPGQRFPGGSADDVPPSSLGPGASGTARAPRSVRILAHLAKPIQRQKLHACLRQLTGQAVEEFSFSSEMRLKDPPSSADAAKGARAGTPPTGSPRTAPVATVAVRPPSEGATPVFESRPRILVVEDNTVNQRVAKVMLEKRGYAVDIAVDGVEAIEATARAVYAAVLMDCQMPRIDGFEATSTIRQRDAALPRVPIIAMTANAGPGARERCLASGMDDYVSKPISADNLDRTLRTWAPRAAALPAAAPAVPRRATPVIDLTMLDKLRGMQREGEPDLVAEVIELFLQDAPGRFSALRDASEKGDMSAAGRAAHTLRGSAGHLGAKTLSTLCGRFEDKARAGATFDVPFAVTAIEDELARVRTALDAERTRIADTASNQGVTS